MKITRILLTLLFLVGLSSPALADYEGEEGPGPYGVEEKRSGFFMGTDQGVLFWVGNSANFMGIHYYGTIFGGYNVKGYIQPLVRISQGFGSVQNQSAGFSNASSYLFIMEAGARFTPLRTKVRPFFSGMAGFYVLNFGGIATPVTSGVDFTFSGGGGLEVEFGRSTITLLGEYRGLRNGGPYLQGVAVTFGYIFQF